MRGLPLHSEPIGYIDLHCFGDASGKEVCAALYAAVMQSSGASERLVTARARLAKMGLSILHLELVSGHMAINSTSSSSWLGSVCEHLGLPWRFE